MSEADYGFDRQGEDYRDFVPPAADPTLCRDACATESKCLAWAYNKPHSVKGGEPRCWLKQAIPERQITSHAVSGVKDIGTGR
jgi:hypothetical protein